MDLTQAVSPSRHARRPAAEPRRRARAAGRFDLSPPPWVVQLFDGAAPAADGAPVRKGGAAQVTVTDSPDFTLVTARVARAADLDSAAFRRRAAEAYQSIADALAARPQRHVVRFWNHIPDIRRRDAAGHDRYMVFNAGRFAACSTWFGGPAAFDRLLPTASAVGHDGPDLVVHALAGNDAGVAVENPRQVPSYRYSRRFGPRPPCFARATVLAGATNSTTGAPAAKNPLILVAGTASIRGEETVHVGDVRGQTRETFENLAVLIESASAVAAPQVEATPAASAATSSDALRQFRDLRVYYVRPGDRAVIARMVAGATPHLADVEFVRADLCRPDLLVEIEGTAHLSSSPLPGSLGI